MVASTCPGKVQNRGYCFLGHNERQRSSIPRSPKPPGHRIRPDLEVLLQVCRIDVFGIDLFNRHTTVLCNPSVNNGFVDRLVGIVEVNVFSDHSNPDAMLGQSACE